MLRIDFEEEKKIEENFGKERSVNERKKERKRNILFGFGDRDKGLEATRGDIVQKWHLRY